MDNDTECIVKLLIAGFTWLGFAAGMAVSNHLNKKAIKNYQKFVDEVKETLTEMDAILHEAAEEFQDEED